MSKNLWSKSGKSRVVKEKCANWDNDYRKHRHKQTGVFITSAKLIGFEHLYSPDNW